MTKTIVVGGLTAALVVLPVGAGAQDVQLGEILVTEGRTPIEAEKSGRAYTVISGEELEQKQVRYVADALRQVPGLHVSRSGALGSVTQLRVRGAEANHVLVLIDGVEVSEASNGEFDFGTLQVADIDRIEVLRGPQSAFWGSNAVAGVVNILTKGGVRNGYRITGRGEGGSDGTSLANALVQWGGEMYDAAFSAAFRRTDGFNVSRFGTEKDGDQNTTLNGNVTVDITPEAQFNATFRFVDRESEFDGQDFAFPPTPTNGFVIDTTDETLSEHLFGSASLSLDTFDGMLTHVFRIEGNDTRRENHRFGARVSGSDSSRYRAVYQATGRIETPGIHARHSVTGGVEFERESFKAIPPIVSPSQLQRQTRDLVGFVGEYRGEFFDRLFVTAAVRRDVNDAFQDATTYSVSGAYVLEETGTRFHASAGTGVTNPTFFEQFGFIPATFVGNPNLTPEDSFGWDIGIEQAVFGDRLIVDVTYFNQDLESEIVSAFTGTGFTAANQIGRSEREGIEVSVTAEIFAGFTATGSYTYLEATDPNGLREIRRPRHSGAIGLRYVTPDQRGSAFADIVFNGEMDDQFFGTFPAATVQLDSYTLVNIGAAYEVTDAVEVFGRVENLFDQDYEEVFSYTSQGLTAFVGLKGTFGSVDHVADVADDPLLVRKP